MWEKNYHEYKFHEIEKKKGKRTYMKSLVKNFAIHYKNAKFLYKKFNSSKFNLLGNLIFF